MARKVPRDTVNDKVVIAIKQDAADGLREGRMRSCSDYGRNVRSRPVFLLLLPLLTFCVLCSLGILGVVLGANQFENDTRSRAESAALDWAASFRLSAEKVFTPLITLSILIQLNPELSQLEEYFPETAARLLKQVNQERATIQELQISPMGVIKLIYPLNEATNQGLGLDIFNQSALRGGALKTLQAHDIVLNGPLQLVNSNFAAIARIPIFIKNSALNETFGTNRSLPTNCTDLCFNPETGEKFWGFATAISPLDALRAGNDTRLDLLRQNGYNWLMTRPYTATERNDPKLYRPERTDRYDQFVFANSSHWPSERAVVSEINLANAVWKVYLEPQHGWRPSWERGMVAVVVVSSMVISVLVGMVTASWAQQQKLLGDVRESNVQLAEATKKLQDEKLRLDALLVRQYNLLAVLGGKPGGGKGSDGNGGADRDMGSPDGSCNGSKEGLTLDRIENMRRQLAVNSNTAAQDMGTIQTIELLGEGTFGKVYKGLWRGTVVAVKTMLLPANMSGSEKREKMAVMEAAISSSLSHPNIVQTYTYAIRPMRELPPTQQGINDTMTSDASGSVPESAGSMSAVHSYEVRLVLEYCDKGSLREALDGGAFLLPGGAVNYLAILETAADIAKAMLHLHSINVLHSDLKAGNVMLATGNPEGRGVVSKVCDFGLSLKMDHLETHISQVFQGTMTHMAPEIMLAGRVSKAADVYAFGITMWEMYTGRRAFEGRPRALLGHQITREGLRPRFPDSTPRPYQELAERCWQNKWELRPSFDEVLSDLLSMRAADPKPTPAMHVPPRSSRLPAVFGSPGVTAAAKLSGSNSESPTLPKVPPPNGIAAVKAERSIYLENSADDSDVLVMRSMTDWSDAPSGVSSAAPASFAAHRSSGRSLPMPQIAEVGDAEVQLEQLEQEHQPQLQQQQQQQTSTASSSTEAATAAAAQT